MKYAITAENLAYSYGKNQVLQNLNLKWPAGEFVALMGPNGSGKSTLMYVLLNLLRSKQGQSSILGKASRELGPSDFQEIGFVADGQHLPKNLTVLQWLNYLRPFYRKWDTALEAQLLKDLDLNTSKKIRQLSRGQQMKAQLISSLCFRPRLLLLDEPLGGLDPLVRDEVLSGLIEALSGEEPLSVVLSSHDIDEVERMATYFSFLDAGQHILSASTSEIESYFRKIVIRNPASITQRTSLDGVYFAQENTASLHLLDTNYSKTTSKERYQCLLTEESLIEKSQPSLKDVFRLLANSIKNNS